MKSKFLKELERRHIREKSKRWKITENYFRAFLSIFPGLEKSLLGILDAERAQVLEDTIEIIFDNISELKFQKLSFSNQLTDLKIELENNIVEKDKVLQNVLQKLNSSNQIPEPFKSDIQNELNKIQSQIKNSEQNIIDSSRREFEVIKNDMSKMLKIMQGPQLRSWPDSRTNIIKKIDSEESGKDDILVTLGSELISNISKMIEKGELTSALKVLDGLIEADGFEVLSENIKIDLWSLKGDILFKKGDYEKSKIYINQLVNSPTETKRKNDFLFFYSSVMQNKTTFNKCIKGFKLLGYSKQDIALKYQYYDLVSGKFDEVINFFTSKKDKKNHINIEYINSKDALYYLGLSYFSKGDYKNAELIFNKSNVIRSSTFLRYLITLCEIKPIIEQRGAFFQLSPEKIKFLENYYNRISDSETENHFKERSDEVRIEYWANRLSLLIFVDRKKALSLLRTLPLSLKSKPSIKFLLADIFILEKNYDAALKVLKKILIDHKKPAIVSKVINLLLIKNLPEKIVEISETLSEQDYDPDGDIAGNIVEAIYKTTGLDSALHKGHEFIKIMENPILVYCALGKIFGEEKNNSESKKWFNKTINSLTSSNYPPRRMIAEECFKYGYTNLALKSLEPFIEYDYNSKIRFLEISLNKVNKKYKLLSKKIIITQLDKTPNDIEILNLGAQIEYQNENKKTSLKYLERSFELNNSPETAYNIIGLKSELNEKGYIKYTKILEIQDEAKYIMMAAMCYHMEGNQDRALNIAYFALSRNGDSFEETIYAQFIKILLFRSFSSNEKIEFDEIELDTSFELIINGEILCLTIESDNTLFSDIKILKFAGSDHLQSNDLSALSLIGSKVKDTINYKDKSYTINQIISKHTFAFRHCLSEFSKNLPDSPFLKQIQFNGDDPLTSFLPYLVESERHKSDLYADYNLRNEIGVPLFILSKHYGNTIFDVIVYIFGKINQPFYSGEINLFSLYNNRLVLSPSVLIILNLLEKLDDLLNISEYLFIPKSLSQFFKDIISDIDNVGKRTVATMSLSDDGVPLFQQITQDNVKSRRDFFLKILEVINKLNIKDVQYSEKEYDENNEIIRMMGFEDFEGVYLSQEINAIYICDDLVVRKYNNMKRKSFSSSNLIGLLNALYWETIETFAILLLKLSSFDYLYLYNSFMLIEFIKKISIDFKIIGPDTIYETLEKIIHNSLKTKICYQNYESILIDTLMELYPHRFDTNIEMCIETILKKLKFFNNFHGFENIVLLAKIRAFLSDDIDKYNYFKNLFINL